MLPHHQGTISQFHILIAMNGGLLPSALSTAIPPFVRSNYRGAEKRLVYCHTRDTLLLLTGSQPSREAGCLSKKSKGYSRTLSSMFLDILLSASSIFLCVLTLWLASLSVETLFW